MDVSSNYNFSVVLTRKLKFQVSWLTRCWWFIHSKNLDVAFCKVCVLFAKEFIGKNSNQKVGVLVNNHFVKR